MSGKKGMRGVKPHEDSERFPEYVLTRNKFRYVDARRNYKNT